MIWWMLVARTPLFEQPSDFGAVEMAMVWDLELMAVEKYCLPELGGGGSLRHFLMT
jgi:hypothetical protein